MPIQFNRATKLAELPTADGRTITVQDLYNQFRDFEDEPGNLDLNTMIQAGGKDDLGGGQLTVITVTLLDGWLFQFEAGAGPAQEIGTITGGNVVALTALDVAQFPIAQTAFVSGFIAQATTGAILAGSGGASAAEVWDYSGALASGGMGDFIRRQVLTIAKFFQIVK